MNPHFITDNFKQEDTPPEVWKFLLKVEEGAYNELMQAVNELIIYKANTERSVSKTEYDAVRAALEEALHDLSQCEHIESQLMSVKTELEERSAELEVARAKLEAHRASKYQIEIK